MNSTMIEVLIRGTKTPLHTITMKEATKIIAESKNEPRKTIAFNLGQGTEYHTHRRTYRKQETK